METKHTKGPWRAGSGTGGKGSVVSDHLAVGALGGSDAVDYYGGYMIAESVAQENIPLIAAAPELLAAMPTVPHPGGKLLKVVAHYEDGSTQTIDGEVIEAVIAKATGAAS